MKVNFVKYPKISNNVYENEQLKKECKKMQMEI